MNFLAFKAALQDTFLYSNTMSSFKPPPFRHKYPITYILKRDTEVAIPSTRFFAISGWLEKTLGEDKFALRFEEYKTKPEWMLYLEDPQDMTLFTLMWNRYD